MPAKAHRHRGMLMPGLIRNERGGGGLKILIFVVVLLYSIFSIIKVVGAKTDDATIVDETKTLMKYAGDKRQSDKDIHYLILQIAKERDIPLTENMVNVKDQGDSWQVDFKYQRDVDLWVWNYKYDVVFNETMPKG